MIDLLLLLIYLLTNSDTERSLLGSRRRFVSLSMVWCKHGCQQGRNMGVSKEDRISMENLYVLKVMEQKTS